MFNILPLNAMVHSFGIICKYPANKMTSAFSFKIVKSAALSVFGEKTSIPTFNRLARSITPALALFVTIKFTLARSECSKYRTNDSALLPEPEASMAIFNMIFVPWKDKFKPRYPLWGITKVLFSLWRLLNYSNHV
jgi:hypothetical protein